MRLRRGGLTAIGGLILAASLVTGCIPYRFVETPGFRGSVVSAKDGARVSGARVTLSMASGGVDEKPVCSVETGSAGEFVLDGTRRWGIYVIPMDLIGYIGTIEVTAPGFKATRIPVKASPGGQLNTDLGTVSLEPAG